MRLRIPALLATATLIATSAVAISVAAPATASGPVTGDVWWHHLTAERTLAPVVYGETFADIQSQLSTYRAEGYQAINVNWPVSGGPTSIYGGFVANDWYSADSRLAAPGTNADTDWDNLVQAAHDDGLKVTAWFNPGYLWTGSSLFQQAEADVATYGPNRANQPADSPARYFEWRLGAGSVTKPCDSCGGSYLSQRWVTDPDATYAGQTVSYYGIWSDQPSGDYSSTEWQTYITGALDHWLDTGLDGFVFDAPQYQLNCNAACIGSVLVDTVHAYSDRAAFGENPQDVTGADDYGFDATESTSFWSAKPWGDAIGTHDPSGIASSATQADRDERAAAGAVAYQTLNPGVLGNDAQNLLAAAALIGSGSYLDVVSTTNTSDSGGSSFGDFGTWPDTASAPALKALTDAVRYDAALDASGSVDYLPTSDDTKYTAIARTSPDLKSKAVAVYNYQSSSQTITVHVDQAGIADGATADLLNGGAGPTISSGTFSVTLPAYGYAFFGVQESTCSTNLCGSVLAPHSMVDATAEGTTDWAHWGANSDPSSFDHKSTGGGKISNVSVIGASSPDWFCNSPYAARWSDGSPTASQVNDPCGIFVGGVGDGFSLTVPTTTTAQVFKVSVGVYQVTGTLTASLSDGSASTFTDSSLSSGGGSQSGTYTLTFKSSTAGAHLTVDYQVASGSGVVSIQVATLAPLVTPASGSLSGSAGAPASSVNLTSEGSSDWAHWGASGDASSFDHKASGDSQINNASATGSIDWFTGNPTTYSWSDGVPTGSASGDSAGIFMGTVGNSFGILVPAGTTSRTLHIYVGCWFAKATLSATLSDGSASVYSDASYVDGPSGSALAEFTLTYQAGSNDQSLYVKLTESAVYTSPPGTYGNIAVGAATLS